MSKTIVFDKDHPNGYVCEVADEVYEEEPIVSQPTAEERLAALESAMLDLIKGGVRNG